MSTQTSLTAFFKKRVKRKTPDSSTELPPQKKRKTDVSEDMEIVDLVEEKKTPKKKQKITDSAFVFDRRSNKQKHVERDEKTKKEFAKVLSVRFSSQDKTESQSEKQSFKQKSAKYTPLEKQVIQLKKDNPGIVLFVEVGYKYRFFGEDAEIASKVLGIVCYNSHNFLTASIPTFRLGYHLRRMVNAGYKSGVVRQTETAALKKAGSNKAGPFTRELTEIYTKSTLISEDIGNIDSDIEYHTGHLVALFEKTLTSSKKVEISVVAVNVATGEILYDEFEDEFMRRELETRMSQLQPSEVLLPKALTNETEKMIDSFKLKQITGPFRVEKMDPMAYNYELVIKDLESFYSGEGKDSFKEELLNKIKSLPKMVTVCLGLLISYLKNFKLADVFRNTGVYFEKISSRTHMVLSATTLKNLEILQNNANGQVKGSLLWLLDHTSTAFGARLMKQWVCHPLISRDEIQARLDAVEEIIADNSKYLPKLQSLLREIPDLERGLMRIHYRKCSPKEFLKILLAFQKIYNEIPTPEEWEQDVKSKLLNQVFHSIPNESEMIESALNEFSHSAAEAGNKNELFLESEKYPDVKKYSDAIDDVKSEIKLHLKDIRKKLKQPSLNFTTWNGNDFVIEVTNTVAKKVPGDWSRISKTKTKSRYHTPFVIEKLQEIAVNQERLQIAANDAWDAFLGEFSKYYGSLRATVQQLSIFDCLFAFAKISKNNSYVKPTITDTLQIQITDGRHPVVEQVIKETYIPNNISLSQEGEKVMIITGPNMGGKSSYIKQVALSVIMAQIGCFIPAKKAILGVFDSIFTRMGASDNISEGKSTFFVELSEASEVLHKATPNSLVVLDELGRGTSTYDGTAIAFATLKFLIEKVKSFTLFVTHYPLLTNLEKQYDKIVGNYHMGFKENDDRKTITFLYKLKPGCSHHSYGINVARMAGLDNEIIETASERALELEQKTNLNQLKRRFTTLYNQMTKLLAHEKDAEDDKQKAIQSFIKSVQSVY